MTAGMPSRRLSISAFGIHTGGGLVLLEALLAASGANLKSVLLDQRLQGRDMPVAAGAAVRFVRRSFVARAASLTRLAAGCGPGDVLLCFNSLPPLVSTAARVVTFVQAPHFVGMHEGVRYAMLTSLRLALETTWFRTGVRHSDEIWVQTHTMARAALARFPCASVAVVPLVDDRLMHLLASTPAPDLQARAPAPPSEAPARFFYPADGVGHKNHATLLQAWRVLADEGLRPQLALTLQSTDLSTVWRQSGVDASDMPHVINLGRLQREEVLRQLSLSSALLFASSAETFGLPMLEARALGVPILAAERDFVRDVCTPVALFDPMSARSIASAVKRFLGSACHSGVDFVSGAGFVEKLLA